MNTEDTRMMTSGWYNKSTVKTLAFNYWSRHTYHFCGDQFIFSLNQNFIINWNLFCISEMKLNIFIVVTLVKIQDIKSILSFKYYYSTGLKDIK